MLRYVSVWLAVAIFASLSVASGARASDGIENFRRMKYGFFAHYTWGGPIATDGTHNRDGTFPAGLDDVADRFEVAGFANDLESMGVEYVIFTAWHSDMNCLWPSAKMNEWLTGHTSQRDLLGEMIAAVRAKGIRVLLYTHPRDGHDMSPEDQLSTGWNGTVDSQPDYSVFDRAKWNNFINEIYGDLVDRYGALIDGLFIDEGSVAGDSWRVVDYPRLRLTIKSRHPDLLMVQNFYGTNYSCDIGATEVAYWGAWVPGTNPDYWPATGRPMSMVMGGAWAATYPQGTPATGYNTTEMFRMTVLRAGINSADGGGLNWAAGPYPDGGWEDGVLEQMKQLGTWIAPIRRSICNTYPSQSWITPPNSAISNLSDGIVATRSADDGSEFIHVLRPPAGNSITIPAPADGRGFASAALLESGHAVGLFRQGDGRLTLTLQSTDSWNPRDTVIELEPVTVAWIGNDQIYGPMTGRWDETAENFVDGVPVFSRFRGGDNVDFAGGGAPNIYLGPSDYLVGALRFSGANYHIYPQGASVMILANGRIDVAGEITASFHEFGIEGSLQLAGSSGVTKSGAGTLIFDLPASYSGNTVLDAGVLAFSGKGFGGNGNIVFNGGTLRYSPGNTRDLSSRIRQSQASIRVDTGGNDVTFGSPLSDTNVRGLVKLGAGILTLSGGRHSPGNPMVVMDGTLRLGPGTEETVSISNPGFELPPYPPHGWSYDPMGTGWSFSENSGTASNGSPWIDLAPEGLQSAFIQNDGAMSTAVSVGQTGNYLLSFQAGNRPGFDPTGLLVKIDGALAASLEPGHLGSGGDFNRFNSVALSLEAGTHTISLEGIQNGNDSDTIIDDFSLEGVTPGSLPTNIRLELASSTAIFQPGSGTLTLSSLTGAPGSQIILGATDLVIAGSDPTAYFAGSITGTGSLTNFGTLRLVGDAVINLSGTFSNHGTLDIMNWNGTLPSGLVNDGTILGRELVRVVSLENSDDGIFLTIEGFVGHSYQLQRSDTLGGSWQNVGAAISGNNAPIVLNDSKLTAAERRFYRVAVNPSE